MSKAIWIQKCCQANFLMDGRFFIVKKQLEMHIIVLQDQYIADNFELVLLVGKGDKNAISQSWAYWH